MCIGMVRRILAFSFDLKPEGAMGNDPCRSELSQNGTSPGKLRQSLLLEYELNKTFSPNFK